VSKVSFIKFARRALGSRAGEFPFSGRDERRNDAVFASGLPDKQYDGDRSHNRWLIGGGIINEFAREDV